MVDLSKLNENRIRAKAGRNRKNVIVDPKFLRKELLKIYSVKDVDTIMEAVCSCDMKTPEPQKIKVGKGIYLIGEVNLIPPKYEGEIPIG